MRMNMVMFKLNQTSIMNKNCPLTSPLTTIYIYCC